jgi:drug/metabolite transporter (DMT)-like permease
MVRLMRLFLLTALTMTAFAANSVLNRWAVGQGWIGPVGFAYIRLLSGAGMLALILAARLLLRRDVIWPQGWPVLFGVGGLLLYLIGFSLAYLNLDAGTGALILFGSVQVTMFAGALFAREALPARRWLGAALALGGLVVLAAPSMGAASLDTAMLTMAAAGLGWGVYSLAGRKQRDAQAATAVNFILAVPVMVLLYHNGLSWVDLMLTDEETANLNLGLALAVLSGSITSGLGYALWYAILPRLGASRAAVAQLTVPVIAALGGAVLLAEWPGARFWLASVLVLGGVALASLPYRSLPWRSLTRR